MPATFETKVEHCSCGVHVTHGQIQDGKAFVVIAVHGATEAEVTRWVADHKDTLKPLLALSVERTR